MADAIFEVPSLAKIYDHFDGEREDLVHYLNLIRELKAHSVLDVGCGTGCFAHLASSVGYDLVGLDPAEASIDIARSKPGAKKIRWIVGDTSLLPPLKMDLAVMTGNVAQVFTSNATWKKTLSDIHRSLQPNGHLIFEVRNPAKKAWLDWTPEKTRQSLDIPKIGKVEGWCEVTEVKNELVSFVWTYTFHATGETITSDSTLRFRQKDEIIQTLEKLGYTVRDIREAPDRPGKEFVFIAARAK